MTECEDAISREDVLDIFRDIHPLDFNANAYKSKIEHLPSVHLKAKVGKWIADVDRWGDIVTTVNGYRCSECNTFDTDKDNYCPNCGAKMSEKPTDSESEE